MQRLGRELLAFEATPDYLLHPLAPARVKALLPGARFVVLLRDPVERAFSHYLHIVVPTATGFDGGRAALNDLYAGPR